MNKFYCVSIFIFLLSFSLKGQLVINELQSSNGTDLIDFEGDHSDWIELYNSGTTIINLENYSLTDDLSAPQKWLFPSIDLGAGEFLVVFASGKNRLDITELHTDFKISSSGESIYLSNASSALIDFSLPESLLENQSWGRVTESSNEWVKFTVTSPGAGNDMGTVAPVVVEKTDVSLKPGFYQDSVTLELTCPDETASIVYSLDGNIPSLVYSEPLVLYNSVVVKSACQIGGILSDVKTDSYFLNEEHEIPVVSLSFNPDDFYGRDSGIYVTGDGDYEDEGPENVPGEGSNFWENWERDVHFEYFVDQDEKIEQDLGVKIFGGWSRSFTMKSLRLIAREELGKSSIDYPFFDEKPYLDQFDQLVLRNSGNDFNSTMWADALNHRALGKESEVDRQSYQPVAVYFNGTYVGLHNLRERINAEYIAYNHEVDHKSVTLLEKNGGISVGTGLSQETPEELAAQIKQGVNDDFVLMVTFFEENDMSIPANYQTADSLLNIPLFIDYFAAQIYHTNWDWPHNNIRFWKSEESDNKWRYTYYDTDFAYGLFNKVLAEDNELNRVINDGAKNVHSRIFKSLLDNPTFKNQFINRFSDLMNTVYEPTYLIGLSQDLEADIEDELTKHFAIYTEWPGASGRGSRIDEIHDFIQDRPSYAIGHIESVFNVESTSLTLKILPQGSGEIKINSVVPDEFPWTGTYYKGIPIEITAIPNEGYAFAGWSGITEGLTSVSTTTLLDSTSIVTANFQASTETNKLEISEINYHTFDVLLDDKDWIEIHNRGITDVSLDGWKLKDDHPAHSFIFPDGIIIPGEGYLIVARDSVAFKQKYPSVTPVIGNIPFGLGNGGDVVHLINQYDLTEERITYDDTTPWPVLADGKGATLERVVSGIDGSNAQNWQGECFTGSPGTVSQPCICSFENVLDEKLLSCNLSSEILMATEIPEGKDVYWFQEGEVISTNNELIVNEVGSYEALVTDGICVMSNEISVVDNLSFDLGEDKTLCSPTEFTLDYGSTFEGVAHMWQHNGEFVSDSNLLFINTSGTYQLTLSKGGCEDYTDQITVSADILPVNGEYCLEDSIATAQVLETNSGEEGVINWFTFPNGGDPLGSGESIYLDSLLSDTTFYVEYESGQTVYGGITELNSASSASSISSYSKMYFEVKETTLLKSVSVSPYFSDEINISVRVLNELEEVVKVGTRTVAARGLEKVILDVSLEPGIYSLDAVGTTSNSFTYLNSENGVSFPISIGESIDILGDNANPNYSYYYYFFYNWEIDMKSVQCDRFPVHLESVKCVITSLEDDQSVQSSMIYPNPTSEVLYVSDEVESILIRNSNGQILMRKSLDNSRTLNVSGLSTGMYFVEMTRGGNTSTEKLVIEP